MTPELMALIAAAREAMAILEDQPYDGAKRPLGAILSLQCAIDAAEAAPIQPAPGVGWIATATQLPDVADGDSIPVIVCRIGADGKPYTWGAWFGKNLDMSEWDGDEDNVITSGFFDMTDQHPSVDEYWSPIDGVTHWCSPPPPPPKGLP